MRAARFGNDGARARSFVAKSHACAAAALLLSSLLVRSARAETKLFVDLDYGTDATLSGCPSDRQFRDMIVAQLGYDPFQAGSAYTVVARAHAEPQAIKGFIEWHDADGTARGRRELGSGNTDCAAFARSMSFAIAVQIQLFGEESQANAAVTPPAPKPADATPPASTSPPARAPVETRAQRVEDETGAWWLAAGAGPAIALGVAPEPAFEGRIFAALRHGLAGAELGAEASLPARHETAGQEGFEQQVMFGSVAACVFLRRVSGCLVNKWGKLQVRGFGVDVPRGPSGSVVQLGPRLTLGELFGNRWLGALRVEALATLTPWRVTLDQREVWKTPLFSLVVGADLGVVFR